MNVCVYCGVFKFLLISARWLVYFLRFHLSVVWTWWRHHRLWRHIGTKLVVPTLQGDEEHHFGEVCWEACAGLVESGLKRIRIFWVRNLRKTWKTKKLSKSSNSRIQRFGLKNFWKVSPNFGIKKVQTNLKENEWTKLTWICAHGTWKTSMVDQ